MNTPENALASRRPVTFYIASWYGLIVAWMFMLYGGVKMILGMLDHSYEGMGELLIFLLIGILMFLTVSGLRMLKEWGWYGQLVVNGLIIILALFGLKQMGNVILLVFSAAAMAALLAPPTKALFFPRP